MINKFLTFAKDLYFSSYLLELKNFL